ncbi:MAG TPA: membrane protein insertion efficiency factor YidD [Candidatus Cloacimonadota bacterium]|nr:membrane protein insertion efficiency factor YidD [Candidatus Cloacimonadota bacterium]
MQTTLSWNSPLILLIRFYQRYITHMLPPSCRFQPTCSHYALQAFSKYPFFKALYLSVRRILKCHPFHKGGYDPLP